VNTDDTPTAEEIEAGRALFAQSCSFVTAAANAEDLPPTTLPEVAFAGRSNVGKSSLLNALTARKTLARTSHTPGRTRQVNFFDMAGRLLLVDLPGYGYARASKTEVQRWTALIDSYLKGRPQLRRVLLLIDSRHGLKDIDLRVMAQLDEAAVSYQIVLTKADKPKPGELATMTTKILAAIAKRPAAHPQIAVTSANAGTGIAKLRAAIAALANDGKAV
jgi:GTP-binding protein